MLLIILGAGASYDSMSTDPPRQWRPPLTASLFSQAEFREPMSYLSEMSGIVHRLRDLPATTTIEDRLDAIDRDSATNAQTARALVAARYYLRWVLLRCSDAIRDQTGTVTNYATLISRVDLWRDREHDEVIVVNFNYDLIFDRAYVAQLAVTTQGLATGSTPLMKCQTRSSTLRWTSCFLPGPAAWLSRSASPRTCSAA